MLWVVGRNDSERLWSNSSANDAVVGCCFLWGPKAWSLELDAPDAPREFPFRRGLSGLAGHRRTAGQLQFSKTRARPWLQDGLARLQDGLARLSSANKDEDKTPSSSAIPLRIRPWFCFQAVMVLVLCIDPNPGLCSDETFGSLDHEHLVFGGETGRSKKKNLSNHHPSSIIQPMPSIVPVKFASVLGLPTRDRPLYESRQVVWSGKSYECPVPTLRSSHTDHRSIRLPK